MAPITLYPGGDDPVTPNLKLALKNMSLTTGNNFEIIDSAFGAVGSPIKINGSVVANPNFVNSSSATFSVIGNNVSIIASASSAPINSAGLGGFWSNGREFSQTTLGGAGNGTGAANQVVAFAFFLPHAYSIGHVTTQVDTSGTGGTTYNVGIYDSNGNKIIDSGAQNGAPASPAQQAAFTNVVLPFGFYYFAYSRSDVSIKLAVYDAQDLGRLYSLNATLPGRIGYAANATVAGAMPVTLGTVQWVPGTVPYIVAAFWEF
jgi:hypothetical protein